MHDNFCNQLWNYGSLLNFELDYITVEIISTMIAVKI